jgi:hypothetical protein
MCLRVQLIGVELLIQGAHAELAFIGLALPKKVSQRLTLQ